MKLITKKEAGKILEKSKYEFTKSSTKLDYVSSSFNMALLELSQFDTSSNQSTNNLNLNSNDSVLSKIKFPINSFNDGFKKINSAANEVRLAILELNISIDYIKKITEEDRPLPNKHLYLNKEHMAEMCSKALKVKFISDINGTSRKNLIAATDELIDLVGLRKIMDENAKKAAEDFVKNIKKRADKGR